MIVENDMMLKDEDMAADTAAMNLHKEILYNYRMAASHLVDAARGLKEMRDTKQYTRLGMETFEDYTEKMCGIKSRQAYTYISALERLGPAMMEEHAGIGITKLSLLAEITPTEREEFAQENDLSGMTVKEIEALVAEKNSMGEQICLFEEQAKKDDCTIEGQAKTIRALMAQIEELKSAPPRADTVTVVEPSEEQLEVIRREAEKKAAEAERENNEKAIREAVKQEEERQKEKREKLEESAKTAEEEKQKAQEELAKLQEQIEREKREASEREQKLRGELQIAGNGDMTAIGVHFEAMQREMNTVLQLIAKVKQADEQKGENVRAGMALFLKNALEKIGGSGE